ncbi:MAG: hypothetical protein NTY51_04260, partial [Deltaproteobacteria bacterium]|nr:hypothetical protein [Deltaproteobacteria bacterium]
TLEHVRKYLGEITQPTDLASMEVDLSLSGEAPKEPAKAAAAAPAKPASKPVEKVAVPAKPAVAVEKPAEPVPVLKAVPKPVAPVEQKVAVESSGIDVSGELSDEDIEALREMVTAFRAIKSFVSDIGSRLIGH